MGHPEISDARSNRVKTHGFVNSFLILFSEQDVFVSFQQNLLICDAYLYFPLPPPAHVEKDGEL